MNKLAWVLAPLLAAAVLLLLWRLRRRRWPSRPTLNVVASLLLLAYLGTTAGLGLFWVANQQLPVFDWHYLFGYATLLLVAIHLGFNLRVVWRHVAAARAGAAAARPAAAAAPPARRHALGLVGAVLAGGVAFVLGLRHARVGLPEPAAGVPGAAASDLVERFHAFSSHSRRGLLLRAPAVDWGDAPAAFKRVDGVQRLVLPPPADRSGSGLARIGGLLWHTAGITARRGPTVLRAAPSSGALFAAELYLRAAALPDAGTGWWHYDPQAHVLQRLAPAAPQDGLGLPEAPLHVVATAVFRRTGHKYRDRAWRYILADLGHALENLRVAAAALGTAGALLPRFDEARLAAALGLDEAEEGVLAVFAAGAAAAPLPLPRLLGAPPAASAALGITAAIYRASSLRTRPGDAPAARPADPLALPPAAPRGDDVLALIARRRSRRRFAARALPPEALAAVLAALQAEGPLLSPALRVDVVVHAVTGIAPGAWHHDPASGALQPRRVPLDLRAAARAAALDQDVIGTAAAVVVLSAERSLIAADPDGAARGYRHALLEAGLLGERIYLAGEALGLGVCAVGAFYDDEAAALVGIDPAREWVLHFAALGLREG